MSTTSASTESTNQSARTSAAPTTTRVVCLASRPHGAPTLKNFAMRDVPLAEPGDGEALIENLFMSVDPYMRGRMNDVRSYVPAFRIDEPLEGGAVGRVVRSRAPGLAAGDLVLSMFGWRDAFVAKASSLIPIDPSVTPRSAWLGVLGITGLTAWVGLRLLPLSAGETVFVSAAAGATGSVVGQLAKALGCRVVGSAGSKDKVAWLTKELGFDAAFDHHDPLFEERLREAAPSGLDFYFDNVGGRHLEAAISAMNVGGRIVACGAIAQYNEVDAPPGPRNMALFITKRLTMKGFIVTDHLAERAAFLAEVAPLVREGKIVARETVVKGLENAPLAFLDLLRGKNTGKMVVQLAAEHTKEARQ